MIEAPLGLPAKRNNALHELREIVLSTFKRSSSFTSNLFRQVQALVLRRTKKTDDQDAKKRIQLLKKGIVIKLNKRAKDFIPIIDPRRKDANMTNW